MPHVDRIQTKYSRTEVAQFLRDELKAQLGATPNQSICEILLADLEFENAADFKAVWNNNFGNVIVTSSSQDYWTGRTWDETSNHFRSYDSPEAGMHIYVHEILRRKVLKNAALEGDIEAFAEGLRSTRYCPDCKPEVVTPTLSKLVKNYQASQLFKDLPVTPPKASKFFILSTLGVAGFVFFRTVRINPNRKLQKS